jgi:hypothetical protein
MKSLPGRRAGKRNRIRRSKTRNNKMWMDSSTNSCFPNRKRLWNIGHFTVRTRGSGVLNAVLPRSVYRGALVGADEYKPTSGFLSLEHTPPYPQSLAFLLFPSGTLDAWNAIPLSPSRHQRHLLLFSGRADRTLSQERRLRLLHARVVSALSPRGVLAGEVAGVDC